MKKIFQISALLLTVFLGVISPIQATVSSEINRVNYTCNGTTTVYNYTFKIYEDDDVLVAKKDASGIQTNVILNSDYTVTGAGSASGTVVLTTGSKCASGYTLSLLRNVEFTQETDYVEGDTFPADSHETALDKITILAQQNAEELNRTLKVQESSTLTNLKVPVVANRVIGWDSAGTGITTYGTTVAQSAEIDTLANHGGSLNQAITDIGSGSQTLFCDSATSLTASVTIPATLHLVALKGCMITKASTYILPINGTFEAGGYPVFSGFAPGDITFCGNLKEVYPEWWGAIGDGIADDTSPVNMAINSLPASGGVVYFNPSKRYAVNLVITKPYVTLKGDWRIGAAASVSTGLIPFSPSSAIIKIGNDTAVIRGTKLDSLYLNSSGPGGHGTIGLELAGGAYQSIFPNVTIAGAFSTHNLKIQGGATYPISRIYFDGLSLQTDANINVISTLGVYNGTQYVTAVFINNFDITGPGGTGTGYAVIVDTVALYMSNGWIEVTNDKGIQFQKTGAVSPYIAGVNIKVDSESMTDVIINTYDNSKIISDVIRGNINAKGKLKLLDTSTLQMGYGISHLFNNGDMNWPFISGGAYFAPTTDPYNENQQI